MRETIRHDIEHSREALASFIQAGFEAAPSCAEDIEKRRSFFSAGGIDYEALDQPLILEDDDEYHPLQGPAPTD